MTIFCDVSVRYENLRKCVINSWSEALGKQACQFGGAAQAAVSKWEFASSQSRPHHRRLQQALRNHLDPTFGVSTRKSTYTTRSTIPSCTYDTLLDFPPSGGFIQFPFSCRGNAGAFFSGKAIPDKETNVFLYPLRNATVICPASNSLYPGKIYRTNSHYHGLPDTRTTGNTYIKTRRTDIVHAGGNHNLFSRSRIESKPSNHAIWVIFRFRISNHARKHNPSSNHVERWRLEPHSVRILLILQFQL